MVCGIFWDVKFSNVLASQLCSSMLRVIADLTAFYFVCIENNQGVWTEKVKWTGYVLGLFSKGEEIDGAEDKYYHSNI